MLLPVTSDLPFILMSNTISAMALTFWPGVFKITTGFSSQAQAFRSVLSR